MSVEERENVLPENVSLVRQFGTSPRYLLANDNEYDYRILSYIVNPDRIPRSLKPILYAGVRHRVINNGDDFWEALYDELLHLLVSINGLGQINQIKGELAMKGMSVPTELPPERPGLLDRVTQSEKYREYQEYKERQELGLE